MKNKKRGSSQYPYLVNGEVMSAEKAAKLLGYHSVGNLNRRLIRDGISPGEDISHLAASKNRNLPEIYIVNGKPMSLNEATRALGYKSRFGLTKKLRGIATGSDISHLTPTNKTKPMKYVVNGKLMSTNQAAKALGFKGSSGLALKIKKALIPQGGDISHLTRRTPKEKTKRITSSIDIAEHTSADKIECLECSKRANGNGVDRQREYQRAYIALKNGDDSLMAGYKSRYGRN